jgi:hypothetical protein
MADRSTLSEIDRSTLEKIYFGDETIDIKAALIELDRKEDLGFDTLNLEKFHNALTASEVLNAPGDGDVNRVPVRIELALLRNFSMNRLEKHTFCYYIYMGGVLRGRLDDDPVTFSFLRQMKKLDPSCLALTPMSLFKTGCRSLAIKTVGKNTFPVLQYIHQLLYSGKVDDHEMHKVLSCFYTVDWRSVLRNYIEALKLTQYPPGIVTSQSKYSKMLADATQEGSGSRRKRSRKRSTRYRRRK